MAGRVPTRDLEVRMDLNDKCNLRCSMCYFYDGAGTSEMKAEVFSRIVDEVMPRAHTVFLSCGAEPFMSPGFIPALERTHKSGVPSIHIVSNGLLMSEKIISALLDNDVEMLEVSLDGATESTYESIRIGGRFGTLRKNLQNLGAAKRKRGASSPDLRLRWVLMRRNLHEVPDLIDFAHEMGAVGVGLQHLVMYNRAMADETISTDALRRQCDEVVRTARKKAKSFGIEFDAPPDFFPLPSGFRDWFRWQVHEGIPRRLRRLRNGAGADSQYRQKCFEPWEKIYINHAGVVTPCPVWRDAPLGSFADQDFAGIWNGAGYSALRHELECGSLRETCRTCPVYYGNTAWR